MIVLRFSMHVDDVFEQTNGNIHVFKRERLKKFNKLLSVVFELMILKIFDYFLFIINWIYTKKEYTFIFYIIF